MIMAKKTIRPRRAAQNQSYIEPEYDSDYDCLPEKETRPSRHSARLQAAYDDVSNTDTNSLSEELSLPQVRRARRSRPGKRKTRSATTCANESAFNNFKRLKVNINHSSRKTHPILKKVRSRSQQSAPIRGIIPQWQSLPYQILLKIIMYAAYPLYFEASRDTGSTAWLLKTSVLSRSFHEACLGALLYSPPLLPVHRAHSLARLLKISREEFGDDLSHPKKQQSLRISSDYRTKIRCLSIETKTLLASKSGIALEDILSHTPVLKRLVFYHQHDSYAHRYIWAQPNHSRAKNRWQYTQLYPILGNLPYHLNLHHFEWNARFLTKDDGLLTWFDNFHKTTSHLDELKSLTFRNFILDDAEKLNETVSGSSLISGPDSDANVHQARLMTWRLSLKGAFSKIKGLRQLSICSSNIFDTASISALPAGLIRLEIVNCPFVNTEGIQSYLSKNGAQLEELILKGNQYMSLDFMTNLKAFTPYLAVVDIDLTYNDPTSFQDTEPLFDSLLPNGPPTWPESLGLISIGPLRKLSAEDAEGFFQSLVDAAEQLRYLRVLELRTLLNEAGWRDRAALRTKWTAKFDEVFNVSHNPNVKPPAPVTCLPYQRIEVSVGTANKSSRALKTKITETDSGATRKSRRIQDLALSDSLTQPSSDDQLDPPSPTHSSLLETFNGIESTDALVGEAEKQLRKAVRHGRCHTVVFELSDQRPAQDQFKEDDFLDDEVGLKEDLDFRG